MAVDDVVEQTTSVRVERHEERGGRPSPTQWMARRAAREDAPKHIVPLMLLEDAMHLVVALLLIGISVAVLWRTIVDVLHVDQSFWVAIPTAINDVLFVVIILEIFRTVLAHFSETGFQLKPFLIIGIISAVRHVLTVGAQLSLHGHEGSDFARSLLELGVNSAVVVALVVALVLIKRAEDRTDSRIEQTHANP